MIRVAVLDDYVDAARRLADWASLGGDCEVVVFKEHIAEEPALVEALRLFDVVCLMRERTAMPERVIAALPRLKMIATAGRRNARIDLAAAAARGVLVSGTQSHGGGVVELTWTLILALFHRLEENRDAMRAGLWQTVLGDLVEGKTLGLLGFGQVGARVARIADAFGMRTLAWSRSLTEARAAAAGARRVEKDALFREADLVSVHLKLAPETRGLVDAAALALMKPTAYLVNTARGPIVEEAALIAALEAGRIAGAAVDVYGEEPLPADHPFRRTPRLLATPHVGFVSAPNMGLFYRQMVEAIAAWRAGAPIRILTPDRPSL